MNKYKCPLCGANSYKEKSPYRSKSIEFANKTIVECEGCGLLSVYPLPTDEELSVYYKAYWEKQKETYHATMSLFKAQAKSRYEFLKPFLPSATTIDVIDIGAGFGLIKNVLRKKLKKRKLNYDAVEIDPVALEYLKSKIKPRNIYSSPDNCNLIYDIMILSHILEHLKEPLSFLVNQKNRVRDGGILFLEAPNQDYIHKLRNEPHIIFLSPETATRLIEKAGYEILKIDSCGERFEDLIRKNDKQKQNLSLMERIRRKIFGKKDGSPFKESIRHINEYGPDRKWIRLVARVKRNV